MKGTLTDRFKKALFGEGGRTEGVYFKGIFDREMFTEFANACQIAGIDIEYAVDCILASASVELDNGNKRDTVGFKGYIRPEVAEKFSNAIDQNRMKGFKVVNDLLGKLITVNTPSDLIFELKELGSHVKNKEIKV